MTVIPDSIKQNTPAMTQAQQHATVSMVGSDFGVLCSTCTALAYMEQHADHPLGQYNLSAYCSMQMLAHAYASARAAHTSAHSMYPIDMFADQ